MRPKLKGRSFTALSALVCLAAEVNAERRMEETGWESITSAGAGGSWGFYFVFSTE